MVNLLAAPPCNTRLLWASDAGDETAAGARTRSRRPIAFARGTVLRHMAIDIRFTLGVFPLNAATAMLARPVSTKASS